jgi:excisionase family DNA binding protein
MARLLTAEQLADRWQVPVGQVYALARRGEIPTVKLGRYRRFAPEAIEHFERGELASASGRAYDGPRRKRRPAPLPRPPGGLTQDA